MQESDKACSTVGLAEAVVLLAVIVVVGVDVVWNYCCCDGGCDDFVEAFVGIVYPLLLVFLLFELNNVWYSSFVGLQKVLVALVEEQLHLSL